MSGKINDEIIKNDVAAENQTREKCHIFKSANEKAKRVLFLGNSITLHETKPEIGWNHNWGMAASAKENDYVHIVLRELRHRYGEVSYAIVNVGEWEKNYYVDGVLDKFSLARDFNADIVIMRFGENVIRDNFEKYPFAIYLDKFAKYFTQNATQIIMTDNFWEHEYICNALKSVAEQNDYTFVSIVDLGYEDENKALGLFEDPGVAIHPGDKGMQRIAERIIEKL